MAEIGGGRMKGVKIGKVYYGKDGKTWRKVVRLERNCDSLYSDTNVVYSTNARRGANCINRCALHTFENWARSEVNE